MLSGFNMPKIHHKTVLKWLHYLSELSFPLDCEEMVGVPFVSEAAAADLEKNDLFRVSKYYNT